MTKAQTSDIADCLLVRFLLYVFAVIVFCLLLFFVFCCCCLFWFIGY